MESLAHMAGICSLGNATPRAVFGGDCGDGNRSVAAHRLAVEPVTRCGRHLANVGFYGRPLPTPSKTFIGLDRATTNRTLYTEQNRVAGFGIFATAAFIDRAAPIPYV